MVQDTFERMVEFPDFNLQVPDPKDHAWHASCATHASWHSVPLAVENDCQQFGLHIARHSCTPVQSAQIEYFTVLEGASASLRLTPQEFKVQGALV